MRIANRALLLTNCTLLITNRALLVRISTLLEANRTLLIATCALLVGISGLLLTIRTLLITNCTLLVPNRALLPANRALLPAISTLLPVIRALLLPPSSVLFARSNHPPTDDSSLLPSIYRLFNVSTAFPAVSVPPAELGAAFGLSTQTTAPATAGGTDTAASRSAKSSQPAIFYNCGS